MPSETLDCQWSPNGAQKRSVLVAQRLQRAAKVSDARAREARLRITAALLFIGNAYDHRQRSVRASECAQHGGQTATPAEDDDRVIRL
jgi:hypothetical protein